MKQKIYIISIEGAGTSALAVIYKKLGFVVAGSDNGDHFYRDIMKNNSIEVFDEYSAGNIDKSIDKIIYSTCVSESNPEFQEAKRRGIPMMSYPEALAELFNQKMGIAVCGTHGKTTTTAILASVFKELGLKPSALVGSKVKDWKGSSLAGSGDYFIIEADEYQNKLKNYNPWSVVLTSIDYDHPDFYPTFEDYKQAFIDFVKKIPRHGFLVYCNDDSDVVEVAKNAICQKISYGFSEGSMCKIENYDFQINNFQLNNSVGQSFEVFSKDKSLGKFKIALPGKHNALNATAVIAMCNKLNLNNLRVADALKTFQGTVRRFEYIGESKGAILIDDYAHHPEEIKTTLKTARNIFPQKNIVTIFHPHSFSRTEALLSEFSQSFDNSDEVIVLDIYGSARESSGNVSSQDLVRLINRYNPKKAQYVPTIEEATEILRNRIGENDLVISMGAGDVWRVTQGLKNKYKA
ncbi:MAG: UDP-N-acetylmuramate--L-alanine ligase [Parcubacteria group bacterium]|jgi:UDP-N-acetylmuramate--alanine ligase